jgi:hypothetical protein
MTSAEADDVMAGGLQFVLAVVACFQKGSTQTDLEGGVIGRFLCLTKAELLADSSGNSLNFAAMNVSKECSTLSHPAFIRGVPRKGVLPLEILHGLFLVHLVWYGRARPSSARPAIPRTFEVYQEMANYPLRIFNGHFCGRWYGRACPSLTACGVSMAGPANGLRPLQHRLRGAAET